MFYRVLYGRSYNRGRYARNYRDNDHLKQMLEELMESAPNDTTRRKLEKVMSEMDED